jgi:two-component system response regulator PilR (NtrC family)
VIEVGDLALKPGRPPTPVEAEAPPAPAPTPAAADVADDAPLPASLPDYLDAVERDVIVRALARTRYNRTQAAQLLGINLRQLRYAMQRLGIEEPGA